MDSAAARTGVAGASPDRVDLAWYGELLAPLVHIRRIAGFIAILAVVHCGGTASPDDGERDASTGHDGSRDAPASQRDRTVAAPPEGGPIGPSGDACWERDGMVLQVATPCGEGGLFVDDYCWYGDGGFGYDAGNPATNPCTTCQVEWSSVVGCSFCTADGGPLDAGVVTDAGGDAAGDGDAGRYVRCAIITCGV